MPMTNTGKPLTPCFTARTKKGRLVQELLQIGGEHGGDPEKAHRLAEEALLRFINDAEVRVTYERVKKWYA